MDTDQSDPKWLAWLARMDEQIARFLSETVPDMPENPWSADGLRRAEQSALEHFPASEFVILPENRDIADQFHRFVGEVFRRNLDGHWMNVPSYDDRQKTRGFGPVIYQPYVEIYLTVVQQLTAAMSRRTGSVWAQIYERMNTRHADWVSHGSLPLTDWVAVRDHR